MFIYGVENDQRRVPGDLKLGVSHRCSMVNHHHDVFRLRAHCRDVHGPARTHKSTHANKEVRQQKMNENSKNQEESNLKIQAKLFPLVLGRGMSLLLLLQTVQLVSSSLPRLNLNTEALR